MTAEALALALMKADSEEEVVALLQAAGYWEDSYLWRYLGDTENNFGSIGNQQSEAVAALIEKLINGVDARLLNACLERGIDPTSPEAPQSIRRAVADFFEDHPGPLPADFGSIALWPDAMATREADQLTQPDSPRCKGCCRHGERCARSSEHIDSLSRYAQELSNLVYTDEIELRHAADHTVVDRHHVGWARVKCGHDRQDA